MQKNPRWIFFKKQDAIDLKVHYIISFGFNNTASQDWPFILLRWKTFKFKTKVVFTLHQIFPNLLRLQFNDLFLKPFEHNN